MGSGGAGAAASGLGLRPVGLCVHAGRCGRRLDELLRVDERDSERVSELREELKDLRSELGNIKSFRK